MTRSGFIGALIGALSMASIALAGTPEVKKPVNTVCPVMFETIDDPDGPTVEFRGQTVQLCCARCKSRWKSMTDEKREVALAKAMAPGAGEEHHGAEAQAPAGAAVVNARCPVGGEALDQPVVTREIGGVRVGFCCEDCAKKWDGMDKVDRLSALAKVADFGPVNDVCPIGGEAIDADSPTARVDGRTVGFCCPSCAASFKKWDEAKRAAFLSRFAPGEIVNTECPVAEHEINADGATFVFMGKTVQLCCPDCVPTWLSWSNERRATALENVLPKR